jgi:hypothetical protein
VISVPRAMGMQDASGAESSAIFAYPEGRDYDKMGKGWDDSCKGYDVAFFDHMLALIRNRHCVDPSRVFAAGFSWGADFVTIWLAAGAMCYAPLPSHRAAMTSRIRPTTRPTLIAAAPESARWPSDLRATPMVINSILEHNLNRLNASSPNGCASSTARTNLEPCVRYDGCGAPLVSCGYHSQSYTLPSRWAQETWSFYSTFK